MKRINYLVMLAAAALMAGCGPKVEQTVLVGHFHNTDDVPEYVILFNEDTGEDFVPTGDTVRYEIDGLKTVAEVFAPETSLNFQVRDSAPILKDVLSRLETDSAATGELRDYCLKLIEEHPSDFQGYMGLVYASLAQMSEEEWLALVDKVAPEIQAKPHVQALKAQYAASREKK